MTSVEDRLKGLELELQRLRGENKALVMVNKELIEKVVLLFPDGTMLLGTDAILHIFEKLDAPWPSFAPAMKLVPSVLRDAAYNTVSHLRKKMFAKPPMVCPTMDPEEEKRFIL